MFNILFCLWAKLVKWIGNAYLPYCPLCPGQLWQSGAGPAAGLIWINPRWFGNLFRHYHRQRLRIVRLYRTPPQQCQIQRWHPHEGANYYWPQPYNYSLSRE